MVIVYTEEPFTKITDPTNASWVTTDLTSYGVPDEAIVCIMVVNNRAEGSLGGVRQTGSILNRYIDFARSAHGMAMFITPTDEGARVDLYTENSVDFYIMGWWTGVSYTEAFETIDVTGEASQVWVEKTLSDEDGERVHHFIFGSTDVSQFNVGGVRTNGSAIFRTVNLDSPFNALTVAAGSQIAKTDVDGKIEAYTGIDQTEMLYWNMGYFSRLMDYTELVRSIGATTEDAWTDVDLSAFLGNDGDIADLYVTNNDENNTWDGGARINGSGDNRIWMISPEDAAATTGFQIPTGTDASGILEYWNAETDHVAILQYGYFFPAEGIFPHKVDGVEGSTIAKIIGVGVENIGKVMGVG